MIFSVKTTGWFHSWPNSVLGAHLLIASKTPSSKLHRHFIEVSSNFSWSCTKFSMMAIIFRKKYTLRNFFNNKNYFKTAVIEVSLKNSCMTTKKSMHLRWNVDEASTTAFSMRMCKWALSFQGRKIFPFAFSNHEKKRVQAYVNKARKKVSARLFSWSFFSFPLQQNAANDTNERKNERTGLKSGRKRDRKAWHWPNTRVA